MSDDESDGCSKINSSFFIFLFFFSSRRRHTRLRRDWSSDVCSSDLRAARLVDYMAEDGILGPYAGSQAREILISLADWEQMQSSVAEAEPAAPPRRRSNKFKPDPDWAEEEKDEDEVAAESSAEWEDDKSEEDGEEAADEDDYEAEANGEEDHEEDADEDEYEEYEAESA